MPSRSRRGGMSQKPGFVPCFCQAGEATMVAVNILLPPAPLRHVALGALDATLEPGAGGVVYVRSRHPLPDYAERLTDRLDHYASEAPDRVFIAERDASGGGWREVTYSQALAAAKAIG